MTSYDTRNHLLSQYLKDHSYAKKKLANGDMDLLVDIIKCNVRLKYILFRMNQYNEKTI